VEAAFGQLAKGEVEVPMPMHIGIKETAAAGPGDCHIKGGYVEGAESYTVKLANVSFTRNLDKGLPAGSGIFVTCDAASGAPLAVFQENRYMTDLRTGAAGAVAVKHFAAKDHTKVAFIGTGVIARSMARSAAQVHAFTDAYAFSPSTANAEKFCFEMEAELGYTFTACDSAEEAVRKADVVFTQTTGGQTVLELPWLKAHATIIASGSDQPTKNELPADVMRKSKMVCDLVRQCAKVGELRTALEAGLMTEADVYAELGEVVNGSKPGRRRGDGIVVVDLTGTGAQDAAIGQVAWEQLKGGA